ncbi:hypothetical protein [Saccharolobus shibatae]|uniref:Capsid protein VP2 n=1 Tax=Sulfolobus spindle-shape virus 1 TaxID=244589 RepID=VP2_SSV1|nr:hypothetical protein [Saccharolobus shibatae]NP_039802.1 VP2 protein [Sulfolobus spindle-shaped virus 1]P20224.1 RecName: Full=Capsid protein VP2 [Sulfolobus spindle-shaped virus 1]CAA28517.1 VP2 protein [Sulfolobus sp.]CAA30204.1 VP2 protein [Sulfolobus spindle-shaped virus 1]
MKWVQKAIKRPGRVHRYLMRLYGKRAFTKDGDIKASYLDKAIKHVKKAKIPKEKKRSLLSALLLAKRLKRMHRK